MEKAGRDRNATGGKGGGRRLGSASRAGNFPARNCEQRVPNPRIDGIRDEADTAVHHPNVDSAGMPTSRGARAVGLVAAIERIGANMSAVAVRLQAGAEPVKRVPARSVT